MSYFRYLAVLAYDGYNYYGFQRQDDLPTIELELNEAFKKWLNEEIKIVGAGRTDRYVHAMGQVIHFDLNNEIDTSAIKKALNSFLPLDIRIKEVSAVDPNFHARFSAKKKEYHYLINLRENDVFRERYSSFYHGLDLNLMKEATSFLISTHNFKSFSSVHTNMLKDFTRTIYQIDIETKDDFIIFKFLGNGFLKYQVRRMMGLIIEIGKKRFPPKYLKEILEKEDPRASQYIAPGKGLYLYKVYY